jgi:twitching motility protein PilT
VLQIGDYLSQLVQSGGSDLHIQSNQIPKIRLQGRMHNLNVLPLDDAIVQTLFSDMHPSAEVMGNFIDNNMADFRYECPIGRFRVNIAKCDGGRKITFRHLKDKVGNYKELGFEQGIFEKINTLNHGLVLITGPTNSGKSTTLASIMSMLGQKETNIITLEDPIEYFIQSSGSSLVTQRELGADFETFPIAIKAALRQDPDIIMVGEMRDPETIKAALLCAETGHLVLATLHTSSIESTINRIVLTFDLGERTFIQELLRSSLKCIIAQRLVVNKMTDKLQLQYAYKFFDKESDFNLS